MRNHFQVPPGQLHPDRYGRFTASGFAKLFAGKTTATRQDAIADPVWFRLTGSAPESFSTVWTERGHELEPLAREQYEYDRFCAVQDGGFWTLGEWVGASPDGLVGNDGLLEIKCPKHTTIMRYLLQPGEVPKEYFWQVHGQMYVTDRAWCDFSVYHPDMPLKVIRVHRDEKTEAELIKTLSAAIEEAEALLESLKKDAA